MMMDRTALEAAATSYSYLRGLLAIPVGAILIASALGNWGIGPLRHSWVFVAILVAAGGAALWILRYYNAHYGRISLSTRHEARTVVATVVGIVVLIGVELLARSRASWSLDLPVNATAVGLALFMLIYCGFTVGLKTRYLIIWGSLFAVGAIPLWDGGDPSNVGLVLAGIAAIAAGIVDHLMLVRTFGPPKGLNLENGDVSS
jgi:hypothetical protein